MKLSQPRKTVFFDHDGTVVDSETIALKSAWNLTSEVAIEFPGAAFYDLSEFVKSFAGKPYRQILTSLYADVPDALSEADIVRLVREEEDRAIEQLSQEAQATEGTPAVLKNLQDHGIEFALVSNSSLRRLSVCLMTSALIDYFPRERIFSAQDSLAASTPKPQPDIYLHAVKELGVEVSNCVAVEDSTSGVRSAITAGIPQVVGYIGGTHINASERVNRAEMLRSAGAHQVIAQMSELIPLVLEEPMAQVEYTEIRRRCDLIPNTGSLLF
jgi:HAD superfamily hydrolase (TIGR01509 family)